MEILGDILRTIQGQKEDSVNDFQVYDDDNLQCEKQIIQCQITNDRLLGSTSKSLRKKYGNDTVNKAISLLTHFSDPFVRAGGSQKGYLMYAFVFAHVSEVFRFLERQIWNYEPIHPCAVGVFHQRFLPILEERIEVSHQDKRSIGGKTPKSLDHFKGGVYSHAVFESLVTGFLYCYSLCERIAERYSQFQHICSGRNYCLRYLE